MYTIGDCNDYSSYIMKYASGINKKFISLIVADKKNKCLLFTNGDSDDVIGFIVYRITKTCNETRFYILLLTVHPKYQAVGYGSLMLNDLFENYRDILQDYKSNNIRIVIHSTNDNVRFYFNNGFRKSRENYLYRIIYLYEKYKDTDIIMTYLLSG